MSHIIRNISTPGNDWSPIALGPVELLLDVPFYVGCFKEVDSLVGGTLIEEGNEIMTPTLCLTKCITTDGTKRYAGKLFKSSYDIYM